MCTIVLLHRVHPAWPVLVAANRDEYFHRQATGARVLVDGPVRVVGGRDEVRAGTWIGATARGFFAGLTNQRTYHPADASLRSRGEVVLEALRLGRTDAVEDMLRGLDGGAYNAFNLMFGDAAGVRVAYVRREAPKVTVVPLDPGVHVLANDRLGSPEFPKTERAARMVAAAGVASLAWPEASRALRGVLADHETPPGERVPPAPPGSMMPALLLRRLQALCVHTPLYGTVSSTMLALGEGSVAHYLFAEGRPCTTPFRDVTGLFERAP